MQPAKLLNMVIFYLITRYIFLCLKKDYKINALQMDYFMRNMHDLQLKQKVMLRTNSKTLPNFIHVFPDVFSVNVSSAICWWKHSC